ncbi:MAG: TetR family transcriptional regulator [Hyphomicrobiales bacterium]|nr:TetR family transcriptional regulator [Hyphomicrobiales bacterium]
MADICGLADLTHPPDESRDTAKIRQIFDGARQVFLADGFDGASMNEIARVSGVSKGTLYVYFDSKEALFVALIQSDRKHQAERICEFDENAGDPGTVLRRFGRSLLEHMTSPASIAHIRTVIGIAGKNPQIGTAFYNAGPAYGIEKLGQYLARQAEAGTLRLNDPHRAATHFMQLCQGDLFRRRLFGVLDQVSQQDVADCVEEAVCVFLRAFEVR